MKILSRRPLASAACVAVFVAAAALAGPVQAQWSWRDAKGNITFSDTPPPSDVHASDIVRQPTPPPPESSPNTNGSGTAGGYPGAYSNAGAPAARGPSGGEAPPPATAAPAPAAGTKTLAEQEADFRKRSADRDKAAQKAEQDEARESEKAATCNQAKGYLEMVQGGTRLMRPDAEGNRSFLDDDQRAAEVQKTQDVIAKNC